MRGTRQKYFIIISYFLNADLCGGKKELCGKCRFIPKPFFNLIICDNIAPWMLLRINSSLWTNALEKKLFKSHTSPLSSGGKSDIGCCLLKMVKFKSIFAVAACKYQFWTCLTHVASWQATSWINYNLPVTRNT